MLPLLCAVREPLRSPWPPPARRHAHEHVRAGAAESTTAGQKPIRKTAATAFGYEIGNQSRRPQ